MISNWTANAFNQVPNASNEIHGDRVAKEYGFKGALVPGATVAAYLIHPFVEAFGLDYLKSGYAHVRLHSPVYDGEYFEVEVAEQAPSFFSARLSQGQSSLCATAEIKIETDELSPPLIRGDEHGDPKADLMLATPENMKRLQGNGCRAFTDRWDLGHPMSSYLKDSSLMSDLFADQGYANVGFLIGMSNWILAANAHMNPWVLVEAKCQNFSPVASGTKMIGEMSVVDLFEKKGHQFVDAEINLFDADQSICLTAIELRAIYRLRGL